MNALDFPDGCTEVQQRRCLHLLRKIVQFGGRPARSRKAARLHVLLRELAASSSWTGRSWLAILSARLVRWSATHLSSSIVYSLTLSMPSTELDWLQASVSERERGRARRMRRRQRVRRERLSLSLACVRRQVAASAAQ